jgi:hypothetical protein
MLLEKQFTLSLHCHLSLLLILLLLLLIVLSLLVVAAVQEIGEEVVVLEVLD